MNKIIMFITLLLFLPRIASAGIMMGEGSITLYAGEKKELRGAFCIFSENENDILYEPVLSSGIEKFVADMNPKSFTLETVNCSGSGSEKRKCVAELCNQGEKTTIMPTITFFGPVEYTFEYCNNLPCMGTYGSMQTYQGVVRNIGSVGAAKITEVTTFWIYYYPYNGWIMVFVIIAVATVIVLIISIFLIKKKRSASSVTESQIPAHVDSGVVSPVRNIRRDIQPVSSPACAP